MPLARAMARTLPRSLPRSLPRRLPQRLLGLALLAALWGGPLPELSRLAMTPAMVLHLGVVALVPLLLAPRLPFPAGPAAIAGATLVEAAVVWGWHLPAAHDWARLAPFGLVPEQASFLVAGLVLWGATRAAGSLGGAVALLATVMHMSLLGALIAFAPRQIYAACGGGPFGLTPLEDQQLAGTIMAGGAAVYLVAGGARLAPSLSLDPDPADRDLGAR